MILSYQEARPLIQEADVLLYRHPEFPRLGWWVAKYTAGIHSHVALASWTDNSLDCVEVREFKGGRAVRLSSQVKTRPNRVDVFRAVTNIGYEVYNEETGQFDRTKKLLDDYRKKEITKTMRDLTGQPYGYALVWKNLRGYLPFYRLADGNYKDDSKNKGFICSSSVAYCYRLHYMDPCPYLADDATKPADLARSPLFHYQFTIGEL